MIIRILSAHPEITESLKELILQPQSEISEVRIWLYEQGYEIIEEHMVFEDGKYYPMFKAVKNPEAEKLTDLEYKYGKISVLGEQEVLRAYLVREIANKQNILQKLSEVTTEKSKGRAMEIKALLAELEEMLSEM